MSVRASLESIFSHLFQEPGLEEGEEGEEDQAAPPLDEAEAAAAAAEAEAAAAPEAEAPAEAPAEAEALRPFTPGMGPNPELHYAKVPYLDRVAEIDEELEQRLIGAKQQQHGQSAVWVVPQLGSCASSGLAGWLWAARHFQVEAAPLGAQPLPRLL